MDLDKSLAEAYTSNKLYEFVKKGVAIQDYVVAGALLDEKLEPTYRYYGPCHASIIGNLAKRHYCYTVPNKQFKDLPGATIFFDWLVNKSALRDAFLTKDPKACAEFGTIQHLSFQGPGFLAAAQLARLGTSEFKEQFKLVCSVLADGYKIHPLLLLLCTYKFNLGVNKEGQYYCNNPGDFYVNSHHLPFHLEGNYAELKALCGDSLPITTAPGQSFAETNTWNKSSEVLVATDRLKKATIALGGDTPVKVSKLITTASFFMGQKGVKENKDALTLPWVKAAEHFFNKFNAKAKTGKTLNFFALEELTETLKLGEL